MTYPCHVCANTMLPGVTYTIPREYDPSKPSCGKVYHYYQGSAYIGMPTGGTLGDCGFCKGAGMVEERRMSRGPRRRKANRRAMLSQPEALRAPTADEISAYRDTFRAELDKRMDTAYPSASPSTESHAVALRRFVENRNER